MRKYGCAVCTLLFAGLGGRAAQAGDLSQPSPIDWRAVPLAQAVRDLADRLDVAYILDPSVSREVMSVPVRLTATHLSGRQAFRWTARSVGLDAVVVDGVVMIGQTPRLPRSWRLAGAIGGEEMIAGPGSGGQEFRSRQTDLAWADAPLSRVSKDVSERFGIDLVFHARIMDEQPLVRLEGQNLGWEAVEKALQQQLDAVTEYDDGVLRVEPRGWAASRPVDLPSGSDVATLAPRDGESVLFRPVQIVFPGGKSRELSETLGRAAGINCRVEAQPGTQMGPIAAHGGLLETLEAARILEGWEWKITAADARQGPILLIRTGGSGRSVP